MRTARQEWTRNSVCVDAAAMERGACADCRARPLSREFLPGREFVVSLWGRRNRTISPSAKTSFTNRVAADHLRRQMDIAHADFAIPPLNYRTRSEPACATP